MTNRAILPEALEDDLLPVGVSFAANALCEMDDISSKLKEHLTGFQAGTLANGKGLYFSETQAEKVLQKLMDAVLEVATSTDGAQDDTEVKEAAAADGGAADSEPFPGATPVSLSGGESARGKVPVLALGLRRSASDLAFPQEPLVPKGNRKARRARK
ncbi:hypothetical protein ACGYLO_11745 [Sulfitobacter sp. 1A13353]|uniref:hypothetical protein n=1 Tax=Sulfitobacter sp. 1A13353 TaxID=3368568 RepID=UPI003744E7F5